MGIKKIQFKDQSISLFQDNTDSAVSDLQNGPLSGGQLLQSIVNGQRVNYVSLTSGQDNVINHGLGYAPSIIVAMAPNVQSTIWSPIISSSPFNGTNATKDQVNLRCSTTCTVSVLVK